MRQQALLPVAVMSATAKISSQEKFLRGDL
jgi:hypothetical protein